MKFFSLIYEGDIHATSDEKIIKAEDYSLLLQASEVLDKAKEEAQKFQEETEENCKKLREEAQKEGFDLGLSQFNEQILKLDQNLKKLRHDVQQAILPLALTAAKKIVGAQLKLHPETIVDIILQALQSVTQNRRIVIYVNKADKDILETNKPKIKEIFEQIDSFSIQERADVSPGGCIIETETGIINASIENQWRALETAFERYKARELTL